MVIFLHYHKPNDSLIVNTHPKYYIVHAPISQNGEAYKSHNQINMIRDKRLIIAEALMPKIYHIFQVKKTYFFTVTTWSYISMYQGCISLWIIYRVYCEMSLPVLPSSIAASVDSSSISLQWIVCHIGLSCWYNLQNQMWSYYWNAGLYLNLPFSEI